MTAEDLVLLAMTVAVVAFAGLAWWLVARLRAGSHEPTMAAKLLLSATATVLCVATVLLGLEVFFRFSYDQTDAFSLMKTSRRWFDRHYQRNSWRLRDDVDYTILKTPGRRRITFVGDSFTAGHGVRDVADRFANRIRVAHPDWDVQVLAINGLDTGAELAYLRDAFARGYQTDDVVLVYCPNDLGDLLPDWRSVVDGLYADFAAAGPLVHHSYALNYLYFRLYARRSPQLGGYYPSLVSAYAGAAWHQQARRLRAFAALARANGARFCVVTFPFLQSLGPDDPFAPAYARIGALWKSLGVPHLDLRQALAGHTPDELVVNRFDAHPNERAHALAADAIGELLVGQDGAPPASQR